MREHRDDALSAFQEALLIADRQDEGAVLLISRLANPRLRSAALVAVQEYAAGLWPPLVLQKAITHVGTERRYPFSQSSY